jgi:hypothetical protein
MFFKITNIDYDINDEQVVLPESFIVQVSDMAIEVMCIKSMLSNYIKDRTGYTHDGFDYEQIVG